MMIVNIANDGPVTLELDSRKFEYLPVNPSPKTSKAIKANWWDAKQDVDKPKKEYNKERLKGENTIKTIESTAIEGKDEI